ncbi:MAG: hypothetical protein IJO60_10565 [Agathobacter sp.]|nr:hypothetical protein [Agathobacter sp.]
MVIKKKTDISLKNEIGKIFQKYNLLEYKSPKDDLNYDVFLKGIAYAYLFKSYEKHVDDILLTEVTLTFIRENPPLKLFRKLKEINFVVEEVAPGIYYINRYSELLIQIVVTKELDEKQHVWINSLTNNISVQHARKLVKITKDLTDLDDQNYADSIWEVVATENVELIRCLREDKEMCNALAKIMKPEIDEAFDDGFNNGQLTQLFNLLKKGIITIEEAVAETELSLEEFQGKYEKYMA